jgi:high affinity sulfate transporter 1
MSMTESARRARRIRIPLIESLAGYQSGWLRLDLSAGLAIAAVALPSAIAYPAIAGLPPETGLYASIAPLIGYALFGPSRQLIVGPDAATMTVLAATLAAVIAAMPAGSPVDRVAVAAVLSLVVGALCLLARALRLGILANFLSRPILIGFFAGISLSILVGQIGRFTAVPIESKGLIPPFVELIAKYELIHWPSLLLAAGMFALLQIVQLMRLPIPGPVVVVALSMLLSAVFDFNALGIAVVGDIPAGLPSVGLPDFVDLPPDTIALAAATIFLVSFGSGIVTARSFGARGNYRVDPNGELVGFGAANIAAGLVGGFPVTSSDSRTAINLAIGGKTQIASLVAALVLMATLLFLNDALRILPVPALGAILAAAALSMIDLASLRQIWRISRMEFVFALIAMFGALSFGVLNGVVLAVGATMIYLLRKAMFPQIAMLGRIAGREGFFKLHRAPEARPVPGLAVCLIQQSLLFFNADHVQIRLREIIEELPEGTRWFLFDASAIVQIDSTGAVVLDEICGELVDRGIIVAIAELHADTRALLERAGVFPRIGPSMLFDNLEVALAAFRTAR